MKNTLLVFLILFIFLSSNGQDKKIQIGVIGSIELNKYYFGVAGFSTPHDYKAYNGYSVGLNIDYELSEKIFFISGLIFYNQGFKVTYNWVAPDGSNGVGDPSIPLQSDVLITAARIPIKFGYKVLKYKYLELDPSLGFQFGFLTNSTETTIYGDYTERIEDSLNELNRLQISFCIDLGIEYNITRNLDLRLTPFISKGLNKLSNNMYSGQFSYGSYIGINYKM